MRLFLASDRTSERFDELIAAAGRGSRVAVIGNAVDFIPQPDREAYARTVSDPVAEFRDRGLDAFDLDLRLWFGRSGALAREIQDVRLVWATGGNAFLLRRAMRQSGLDEVVAARLAESMIYGGWSAGACVAGPSLRGLELMDDPHTLAVGYEAEPVWEGLGLVDFAIVPHFQSSHAEAEAADRCVAWLTQQDLPFRTLRDGEAIVV